ncbi:MAG: hypothetical protein H0X37_21685 [Herpetosiphonaceae bacterium]|nr:hypothetical protein [Herpetosiphonaceae bacterium]
MMDLSELVPVARAMTSRLPYDGVDRRTLTTASGLSIQQGYDALGERTTLQDSTATTAFSYNAG